MDNKNLENLEVEATKVVNDLKMSAGTIRRLVGYIITSIIQGVGSLLGITKLVSDDVINLTVGIITLILVIAYIGFNGWIFWKNNSITKNAILSDIGLAELKKGSGE